MKHEMLWTQKELVVAYLRYPGICPEELKKITQGFTKYSRSRVSCQVFSNDFYIEPICSWMVEWQLNVELERIRKELVLA
jgi:hypothetical protein